MLCTMRPSSHSTPFFVKASRTSNSRIFAMTGLASLVPAAWNAGLPEQNETDILRKTCRKIINDAPTYLIGYL
jgi:hypothetical protein